MYGQIHLSVRSWILDKYGEEKWEEVIQIADVDEFADFMIFHHYDDARTVQIIGAVCQVLSYDLPTCLEEYGDYFFMYCFANGQDKILQTLGADMYTFIQNLDPLHVVLQMTYTDIIAPSFRCEKLGPDHLKLHYYSKRAGLYPLVKGVLTSVARELFDSKVFFKVLDVEAQTLVDGQHQEHVTFDVVVEKNDKEVTDRYAEYRIDDRTVSLCPRTDLISADDVCDVLPYHIIFGPGLEIKQIGESVERLVKRRNLIGKALNEVAQLILPNVPFDYKHVLEYINGGYTIEFIPDKPEDSARSVQLKGQMIPLKGDGGNIIFMNSPNLVSLEDLLEKEVFVSDIPFFDATRDLIVLNQHRLTEIQISKKLDETTAELKIISKALEKEKEKTEFLLYQMLPKPVAAALKEGSSVAAEKFAACTILFSDIVTFTNIAASVTPIDIVNMLNELYIRFDNLTNVYDVYKVETIGDAYMIVGGVPTPNPRHTHEVAGFALDMVVNAAEVKSPATGKPLQIRVGFHSGPVVAGVVGKKMPRYCLFGDTVNTSSRMESHGVPARIHFSGSAFENIKESEFKIKIRGLKFIKGKGLMTTYFLVGKGERDEIHGLVDEEPEEGPDELPLTGPDALKQEKKKKNCVVM